MKNNYNLINGLFSNNTSKKQEEKTEKIKSSATFRQRTFKISNEFWYDFVDLAAARRLTQAELINQVIEDAVKDNLEEIDRYRSFFHKSFLKKN